MILKFNLARFAVFSSPFQGHDIFVPLESNGDYVKSGYLILLVSVFLPLGVLHESARELVELLFTSFWCDFQSHVLTTESCCLWHINSSAFENVFSRSIAGN